MVAPQLKKSLARATMQSMAVRITAVVIVGTGAAYLHMRSVLTDQHLQLLSEYVLERGTREAGVFALAKKNHDTMAPLFLKALGAPYRGNARADFERLFKRESDGSYRDRDPKIDTYMEPTFYHGPQVPMSDELRERLLKGRAVIRTFAHAYQNQFADTYFTTPENSMFLFWPGLNWGRDAPPGLDMRKEEYIWVADSEHNPDRKTRWTGTYYDVAAKVWMVSIETPLYAKDRIVATIGHDITLSDLLDRVITRGLPGTKNIILRLDGRLIAHPDFSKEITEANGNLLVTDPKRPLAGLREVFDSLQRSQDDSHGPGDVFLVPTLDSYFGKYFIEGPDWYFLVQYPRKIIDNQALAAARFILLLGLFSLVTEIVVLYFVIKKQVGTPLGQLAAVAQKVESGDFTERSALKRADEIGFLSDTFNRMLEAIQLRDRSLTRHAEELEHTVRQRTLALEQQREQSATNAKLAALGVMAAGVAHEINNPLAVIHARADQLGRKAESGQVDQGGVRETVKAILRTVDRIAAIVRGLRTFARDGTKDPFLPADLKTVVDDALSVCGERIRAKGISIKSEIGEQTLVLGRAVQLTQIVVNLISNAADAVESLDEKWIGIRAERVGSFWRLISVDSGRGIPKEVAASMMTPFFTTKGVGKGTGLGLSISYGIAREHGGNLVYNERASNTEFWLDLPVAAEVAARESA